MDVEEDAVDDDAWREGETRVLGVRGEGMECRRSGNIGLQFDVVDRRSFNVVKHDF